MNQAAHLWLIFCLIGAGLAVGVTPAWAADISWRFTSKLTSNEGGHYTREGTAAFMTGEEAHVVVNGTVGPNSDIDHGTSTVEQIFRFKDGSGFALHGVATWNESLQTGAGIFADGVGRFAGMTGSATFTGNAPVKGQTVTVWTGGYELSPK
jgi:hypothetical protein